MHEIWTRLRQARLFRVLAVYIGASWAVLEVTDVFIDEFGLPGWFFQAAILLLLIGLVILVTTAWVQTRSRSASEAASPGEVPSPWEVDLVDLKQSVTRGRLPHLTWARAALGGVVAFSLLFGVGGLYVILNPPAPKAAVSPVETEAAAPAIAVLPFRTVGDGMELWREGMVDLLSTNLDGAAGLRTIAPRTVLSGWRQIAPDTTRSVDQAGALQVAQHVGARYAVLGSAVSLGGGVRLTAEVYTAAGELQGRAQVEGHPDSVFTLVDELSLEVLRSGLVSDAGELPTIALKGVTTSSVTALKAYLQGEQKFRRSRFREAIADFSRALEADSTFALALYRISQAYGWVESFSPRTAQYGERAARFADRLPEREALLLKGNHELDALSIEAVEHFEALTARYPDYVEAWQALGEAYYHVGEQRLYPAERYRQAFRRALELDPGFGPTYIHLIDDALVRGDSATARDLIERHRAIDPTSPHATGLRLVSALAWGDSAAQDRARTALDTSSADALFTAYARFWWSGARYPRELMAIGEKIFEPRRPPSLRQMAFWATTRSLTVRGRYREAGAAGDSIARSLGVRFLRDQAARLQLTTHLSVYPDLEAADGAAGYLAEDPGPFDRFLLGALAAAEGRWDDVQTQIEALESDGAGPGEGEVAGSGPYARALRGYVELGRGDYRAAADRLESVVGVESGPVFQGLLRFELGKLWLELEELEKAERYFESLELRSQSGWAFTTPADYYLGEVSERLGDLERARLHYARFARAWANPDPELEPWRDRAQAILERLSGEAVGSD